MLVFRICKEIYANDLSGEGARLYGGRWNKVGTPLVYTSCFASLAVLELLVHFNRREVSFPFIITCLEVNAQISILEESSLPEDWTHVANSVMLHRIAENWINQDKTVGLQVPSAILPIEHNLLLNPLHNDFKKVTIRWQIPFYFDERLLT